MVIHARSEKTSGGEEASGIDEAPLHNLIVRGAVACAQWNRFSGAHHTRLRAFPPQRSGASPVLRRTKKLSLRRYSTCW
jgi:hypothetical protein